MSKKILLAIAALLVLIGYSKLDLSFLGNVLNPARVVDSRVSVAEPSDPELKEKCLDVVKAFKNGSSSRTKDAKRLGDLYVDLATLIELEGDNTVVKTTDEIRGANSLSGTMLRMNIKGDYPDLAQATNGVVVTAIGQDNIVLNAELRKRSAEAFMALAWACYEGSK
jgi:hypothetical protein